MHEIKNILRSMLTTYDSMLYTLWRAIEHERNPSLIADPGPLISIIVPTYNTDLRFLDLMIASVRSQRYQNWELILVDDASPNKDVRDAIESYSRDEPRLTYEFLANNAHIAGATNVGIKLAKGDYVALLDHDDVIYPNTLAQVVSAIKAHPDAKFLYTDEDKIIGTKRVQPLFKTDWNLGLLHCVNYITHFAVMKKETLDQVGYEDGAYNGAQDWELFLRIGRNINEQDIVHIPQVLYSWRVHELSTASNLDAKPYVIDAQQQAVEDDLKARGINQKVYRSEDYAGQLVVSGTERGYGLSVGDLRRLVGTKRTIFILLSSRMALSRHIYRTTSYDRIVKV